MGLTVVQCSCLHSLVVKFIFVGWELSFDVVSTIFYKVNRTTASSPQIVFLVEYKVTRLASRISFVEIKVLPQWICNTGRSMNYSGKKKVPRAVFAVYVLRF
jgi:hypothetical protein